jgi:hypothetical protein
VKVRALGYVQQDELLEHPDGVAVLTAPEAVYVWKGRRASKRTVSILLEVSTCTL